MIELVMKILTVNLSQINDFTSSGYCTRKKCMFLSTL